MAFSFDGAGDFMVSPTAFNNSSQVSVSFRIKIPTGHGNAQFDRIFELGGFATGDGGLGLEVDNPTTRVIGTVWDASSSTSLGTFTYTLDVWHNIIFTSDTTGPNNIFYVDGVLISADVGRTRATTQTEFTLAARNDDPTQNQTEVAIADFAIWHGKILDAKERAILAAGFSPKFISLPLSGYDLIRNANDYAGGQNLTITNAVPSSHPRIIYPSAPIIGIPVAAAGFPTGWARKVKVTIQPGKVPGTLTNYPALITEVNLPQGDDEIFDADGLHAAINGGGDIRASSDAAGSTQLPLHVVSFVTDNIPANGTCELWVKIPSVSSSVDTDFYIWWEKAAETQPAVSDTFGRNNVWTEAELVVLMEDSVPVDSTGNHVLTLSGGLTNVAGPFGRANFFVENDRLSNTDAALVDIPGTYDTTISLISRKGNYAASEAIVSFEGTDDLVIYPMDNQGVNFGFRIFWRDLGGDHFDPLEALADEWIWNDFTTRASNDHEGYTNASSIGTFTDTGTAGPFTTFFMGGFTTTTQDWGGDIAQVIVWATARADAWLTAQYNNQFDPATFIIEGTPEAAAGGATPVRHYYDQYLAGAA